MVNKIYRKKGKRIQLKNAKTKKIDTPNWSVETKADIRFLKILFKKMYLIKNKQKKKQNWELITFFVNNT